MGGQQSVFKTRYELTNDHLGTGGFSVVVVGKARELKFRPDPNQECYAIKEIQRSTLTPEDLDAIEREIDVMSSINHPHVIRMYEHYDEANVIYMVTELVSWGELFDRIVQKERLSEGGARDVVKTILTTMAHLHANGIVHRDLKPENILLADELDDSSIKIADFGFAARIDLNSEDAAHALRTNCGTPGYVAPEILSGMQYGIPVDVWSIGVITYILLGGYPPFYHHEQAELFKIIMAGDFQFHAKHWNHISDDAKDLICSMLTVDPSQRLSCEQLLQNPWITSGDELNARDITQSVGELKRWNAKRKFKGTVHAMMAARRMSSLMSTHTKDPIASEESVA